MMNENFTLAGKGLKYLFLAEIFALVAVVVMIVPILGWLAGAVLAIASLVLSVYGPYVVRNAHLNFQNAFYASLVALLVGILSSFFKEGLMAAVFSILSSIVGFLVTYFVCTAAEPLLDAKGDGELAQRAVTIWKLYAGCTVVSIACTLVSWIPLVNILAAVAGVVASVVQLVAHVLLIIFYYKASNFLLGA